MCEGPAGRRRVENERFPDVVSEFGYLDQASRKIGPEWPQPPGRWDTKAVRRCPEYRLLLDVDRQRRDYSVSFHSCT